MIKVIEKNTNEVFVAKRIEGGFEVFYITDEGKLGERYKKLKESTFKKFFRTTGESWSEKTYEKPEEEKEKKIKPTEPLSGEKKERIIEKIKKMLALSENNPSQEEAISAALQAQKLMLKYNIHEEDVTLEEIKEDISSVISSQKHNSHLMSWRKQLALIVARNFRCKCYLVSGKDVTFRGYTEDAQLALDVYLMLYNIGDKLGSECYMEQLKTTGSGKGAYNSFIAGFLKGIEDGFHGQCTELMVITPQEVEDEFKEFCNSNKCTEKKTSALSVTSASLYKKGHEEGKKVVKGRAIGKRKDE